MQCVSNSNQSLQEERWDVSKINKLLDVMHFVTDELKVLGFKAIASELKTPESQEKAIILASIIENPVEKAEALALIKTKK